MTIYLLTAFFSLLIAIDREMLKKEKGLYFHGIFHENIVRGTEPADHPAR